MEYYSIITSLIHGKSAVVAVCFPSSITVTPFLMSWGIKNTIPHATKGSTLTCCISLTFILVYNTALPFQTLLGSEFLQNIQTLLYLHRRISITEKNDTARCAPAANNVCRKADTLTVQTAKHNQTSY
jgi:hypothetical protein